jgi:uncharacterized membrane-anchored protein
MEFSGHAELSFERWLLWSPSLPLTAAMVVSGVLAAWARRRGGARGLWALWLPAHAAGWAAYARWADWVGAWWQLRPWWWAGVAAAATALAVELAVRGRLPARAIGLVAAAVSFAVTGYVLVHIPPY